MSSDSIPIRRRSRAKRKAERSAVSIRFDQGFSHELPYPEASFDRVFYTIMFHHLMLDKREMTLCEVRRGVLTPGGSPHMLDFAGTEAGGHGPLTRYFHSTHRLKDNSEERILTLMNRAGFQTRQLQKTSEKRFRKALEQTV